MLRRMHGRTSAGSWLCALAVVLAPTVSASILAAQGIPTVVLKARTAEHEEPLSQPGTMLELGDGRVLVTDTKDRTLMLYDFARESAYQVSRQGAGPLEYQLPGGVFAVGDAIVVIDVMLQRMLVLDRSATPLRTHRLVASGDAFGAILKLGTILAVDEQGRFYTESRGVRLVPGRMPTTSDTVALLRWASLGMRGDTVVVRVDPALMPNMSGGAAEGVHFIAPGGKLQWRVRFPKDVTLLGFGKGNIYATRKDEDDLRYLQRFRLH